MIAQDEDATATGMSTPANAMLGVIPHDETSARLGVIPQGTSMLTSEVIPPDGAVSGVRLGVIPKDVDATAIEPEARGKAGLGVIPQGETDARSGVIPQGASVLAATLVRRTLKGLCTVGGASSFVGVIDGRGDLLTGATTRDEHLNPE